MLGKAGWSTFIIGVSFVGSVSAETITLTFDDREALDSATAVWNQQVGEIHPPLTVYAYDDGPGGPAGPFDRDLESPLDLGDGGDGAFEPSRYQLFDSDGDSGNNVIQINTDDYPSGLSFTQFSLSAGVTISPVGSEPLIIKSLGNIVVSGVIDCSGGNGGASDSSLTAGAVSGGAGRCGGQNGGTGGWHNGTVAVDATAGTNVSLALTGGAPGLAFGGLGGAGGGGGGAPAQIGSNPAASGDNPNGGAGGAAGTSDSSDVEFLNYEGGAGGGGGAHDPNGARGGGGGAGGGTVVLVSYGDILINSGGRILAKGGDGGGNATLASGGGGGGGGGSILAYAGGQFTDDNPAPGQFSMSTEAGQGGVSAGQSDGGSGADGRIWFTDRTSSPSTNNSEAPALYLADLGRVLGRESGTPWVATTTVIDLESTYPLLNSASLSGIFSTNNTASLYVAMGDRADFTPTWILASTLAGQKISRFLRLQVRIDNQDRSQPMARVQSITVDYTRPRIDDFSFTAAGCGRVQTGGGAWGALFPVFALLIGVLIWRRQLKGSHL